MKLGIIFFIWVLLYDPLKSQNLVPNPGFEIFENCPADYTVSYRRELIPGWVLPSGGTPDYFNSCTRIQVGVPQNFMGYCLPKEGQAYAGLILLLEPPSDSLKKSKVNYREYLQAKLNEPLKTGQRYHVKFYFSLAHYSTFAVNRLGIYLSEKKISKRRSTRVMEYNPQVMADTLNIITEHDNWFEVSGIYKAQGGEQYITIGNFYNDKSTRYKYLDLNGIGSALKSRIIWNQIAYYYIDMVSVCPVDEHSFNE